MLEKLKHIVIPQKAAGLEIILEDNKARLVLVVVELKNNLLQIEKKVMLESIESLTDYITTTDVPINLVVNGKGVLHKKVKGINDKNHALQSALPNAKLADFYFQHYDHADTWFISIARKLTIDELLVNLKAKGFLVVSLSLGGLSASSLIPLLDIGLGELSFSGHTLTITNLEIFDYKFSSDTEQEGTIQIDKEVLENKYLLAYAAAFSELLSSPNKITVDDNFFMEQRGELKHKRVFKVAGMGVLCFFLFVLVVNYLFLDNYKKDVERLSAQETHYAGMMNKASKVQEEVKEKEVFLSEAGWFSAARQSYYADRIASTVPAAIKLTSLSINPLNEKESRTKKKLLFSTGVIHITGECSRATELNPWLQQLKKLNQVYKAEIINYAFDKDKKGIFNIQLLISD